MKKKIVLLLIVSMLLTTLTGCVKEKATITTTIYPVKYIVQQLAGDKVNVEYLSTDEFIQRASLAKGYDDILRKTTCFIYIDELEPYLDTHPNLMENYDFDVINLARLSAIYDFKRYTKVTVNNVSVITESNYYEGEAFADVDIYKKDPFIWLDPIAMSSMASTIKDWLIEYYPEETLVIENNFKTLRDSLVRMDAEYQELNNKKDIKIVTVTASFGNWQKLYGVQVYPLILSKYGVLPTDEQLAIIKSTITANKVKYIAYDPTLPEDMQELYQKVKTELKLTEITLSSLTRLSETDIEKDKTYSTIMYENLKNLESAFK